MRRWKLIVIACLLALSAGSAAYYFHSRSSDGNCISYYDRTGTKLLSKDCR